MRRLLLALLIGTAATPATPAFALFGMSERQDGGQPGAFLREAVSARPLGMGGAFTGVADDASAPFWNASGLSQIQRFDAITYYSRLGEDASLGSGAFAIPTSRLGTFSINYVGLQSGSFARRDEANTDLGTFENNASALLLSQGLPVSTRFSVGYTLKAVRQTIAGFSDTGYGADLGFMYKPAVRWQAGLSFLNLVRPSLQLRNSSEKLPGEMRLGGRFDASHKVTLAADAGFMQDRTPTLSIGTEWRAVDPLALRVGANEREMSAGVGIALGDAGLDYAFGFPVGAAVRDELGMAHRISLHFAFGRNVMAGSYKDLARRREEQRIEIVRQAEGVDHVKVLEKRMADWDGRMDLATFGQVQAARRSLRELAFRNPDKALEAQAYITHFQGRFPESVRLFEQLEEAHPHSRRIRKDAEIAKKRMEEHPDALALAQAYDKLDARDRERQRQMIADAETLRLAEARATENAAAADAGGAGSTSERAEESRKQVAFMAPVAPPVMSGAAIRPPVQKPQVAPPPPVERKPVAPIVAPVPVQKEPEPQPERQPEQKPAVPVQPAVVAPQPPVTPPPVNEDLAKAQESFQSGDYTTAHILTKRALEQNPNDEAAARQAILTNAVVSARATETDPTAQPDMPAIEASVDQSLATYRRGLALRQKGRREEALLRMDEAIQQCPANYLARNAARDINQEIEDEKWRRILRGADGR